MIPLLARLIFWALFLYLIGHGVVSSFSDGEFAMAVGKLIFFPLTFAIYPWTAGLGSLFIVALVAYWVSTIGGMEPVG